MNGRTAQDSRIPVNGTAPANGQSKNGPGQNGQNAHVTGHGPQPNADLDPPAHWQAGQQVGEIRVDQPRESVRPPEWLSEVRDRPRVTGTTSLRQFNTPVRVDEIAVAAMTLAEDLQAATQNMPESADLRRFRRDLDQAATTFRDLASKLEVTAGKLVRLAANEDHACGVGWGVCPEHGLTLMNVGDTVTCHVLGCGLQNVGEVERCEHPVAYRVVDAAGPSLFTCSGHAIACRLYFDNPVITATADSMELF
jgi:hypothetical protein